MGTESWVEDESHRTINGEKWVARECEGGCVGNGIPDCEWRLGCFHCTRPGYVRWYRADSPALAFFDKPKEETPPTRLLSDIATDGVRAWLRMIYQDRDRQAVEALRDSQATSLDDRVQAALDAILNLRASESSDTPAPEDDVEIIIDPTPERVPEGGGWGCWWDFETDDLGVGRLSRTDVLRTGWRHFAILVRGHLTPSELIARVRKMLAEKEGK